MRIRGLLSAALPEAFGGKHVAGPGGSGSALYGTLTGRVCEPISPTPEAQHRTKLAVVISPCEVARRDEHPSGASHGVSRRKTIAPGKAWMRRKQM